MHWNMVRCCPLQHEIWRFSSLKDYREFRKINYLLMHNLMGIKIELDQKWKSFYLCDWSLIARCKTNLIWFRESLIHSEALISTNSDKLNFIFHVNLTLSVWIIPRKEIWLKISCGLLNFKRKIYEKRMALLVFLNYSVLRNPQFILSLNIDLLAMYFNKFDFLGEFKKKTNKYPQTYYR